MGGNGWQGWIEVRSRAYHRGMAKRMTGALLLMVIAVTPRLAAADDADFSKRTELGVGTLIGRSDVGSYTGPGIGAHVDLLHQFGRLGLLGEYNFLSVGQSDSVSSKGQRGIEHRFGGALRYNIGEFGANIVNMAVWGEAGLGREWIRWDGGGRLTRNDVAIGFGFQPTFMLGRGKDKKTLGYYMAVRFDIANSPTPPKELPPICAGPCDEPTGPPPYDYNVFFSFGITFGR